MINLDRMAALYGLQGKVAIVTGGAMGLGAAISELFAIAGATVVIADIDQAASTKLIKDAIERNIELHAVETDITEERAVDRLVASVLGEYDSVDVLVNNAGIYPKLPLLECPLDLWEKVQDVNLRGTFLMTRATARAMAEQGRGGAVVNVASAAAFHPSMIGLSAYVASKGGMVAFTRSAALELAPDRIRVNALCPAGFDRESREGSALIPPRTTGRILLGRSDPERIAAATMFLASEASSHITGQTLVVDGGFLLS